MPVVLYVPDLDGLSDKLCLLCCRYVPDRDGLSNKYAYYLYVPDGLSKMYAYCVVDMFLF